MKKLFFICLMALVAVGGLVAQEAAAQDQVEGYWKSIDEKTGKVTAAWKIYQKDSLLYGEIVTVPGQADSTLATACTGTYRNFPIQGKLNERTVVNTPFIFGLKMRKPGQWDSGNIIDPSDGKFYQCKIIYRPADAKNQAERLEMRGEIGLGIGRSQFWIRTTEDEIEGFRFKG